MENLRCLKFIETFDQILVCESDDLRDLTIDLGESIISILSSLPAYKILLEEMKGREDDITSVLEKLKDITEGYMLSVNTLLETVRDINNETIESQMDITLKLSLAGAIDEIVYYDDYPHVRFKSDLARTYTETLDNIFDCVINGMVKYTDDEVARKRSLLSLTDRLINDLDAFKELVIWARNNERPLTVASMIGTFSNIDFSRVDTVLLILLDRSKSKRLLTAREVQTLLKGINASPELIRHEGY